MNNLKKASTRTKTTFHLILKAHFSKLTTTKLQQQRENDYMQAFVEKDSILPSFSEVKKSLETLRKAAPSIFTDQMVDTIYQIIAKRRLNEKIRSNLANDSQLSHYGTLSKVKSQNVKEEEKNVSSSQRNRPSQFAKNRASRCVPESQKNYRTELEQIWKAEHQKILFDLYIQGRNFAQMQNRFQLDYPEIKQIFTRNTIRCKFFRTIRAALRYLQNLTKTFEEISLPILVRLDNKMIKSIMKDPLALPSRLKVLEVYICSNATLPLVIGAIETINRYFHGKSTLQ